MTAIDSSTITQSEIDRFMSYVRKDEATGAWLWTGGISSSGYGAFWIRRKTVAAHRFAWLVFRGNIPVGQLVCHKFEDLGRHNVNPNHLFLGTQTDNMLDASAKDRTLKGARNRQSVLTGEQAVEIYHSNETCMALSLKYGVSDVIISKIRRGELWSSATGAKLVKTHNMRNKTGYPGVRFKDAAYEAAIGWMENGKYRSKYLGRFPTAELAHEAYLAAKAERAA